MSSGEFKSIDLIVKLALMDIAKIKANSYPDILIFDEILDSSVDGYRIEQILEIIRMVQARNNLKVYIISHRQEINNILLTKVQKSPLDITELDVMTLYQHATKIAKHVNNLEYIYNTTGEIDIDV